MSAQVLSTALDKVRDLQLGENKNLEYKWSNENFATLLTQFYFQLTRPADLSALTIKYQELLKNIFKNQKDYKVEEIKLLFKLVAHTRDIVEGKGSYSIINNNL